MIGSAVESRRSGNARQSKGSSSKQQIPTPFIQAPPSLAVFTDRLDPALVYITHIDRFPRAAKQSIFLIPILLNGVVALLLIWRACAAAPTYWALIQTLLRMQSSATVDAAHTTRRQQFSVLFRRTFMFLLDFLLLRFIGPWPLTFFFERPQNPCSWRWKLGFRDEEIVVRQSRGWGTQDLMVGVKQGHENAFFKTRILPAIEKEFMRKTGYLMMDRSWDLDFEMMLDAHQLVDKQDRINMQEIDKVVWGHMDGVGWLMWQWEGPDGGDVIEERRKKVVAFKDKLTAMGKESLFWKWMEIVEEERDLDGDFTPEQQSRVAARVQAEFDKQGIDFAALSKSIGGLEEVKPPASASNST